MTSEPWSLLERLTKCTMSKKSENVSYTIWTSNWIHSRRSDNPSREKSTGKEEMPWFVSTLVLISFMPLPGECLVLMFGSMVQKRLKTTHISILLIMSRSARKKKWKFKMKPTKLSYRDIPSANISKTKKLQKKSLALTSTKEVSSPETLSESSTFKELMSKLVVALMLIILQRSDGSKSSRPAESAMESWDYTSCRAKKSWKASTIKRPSSTNSRIFGVSSKTKSSAPPRGSSTTTRNSKSKHKTKRCHCSTCKWDSFLSLRMTNSLSAR